MSVQWRLRLFDISLITALVAALLAFFTPWGSTTHGGCTILIAGYVAFVLLVICRSRVLRTKCGRCGGMFQRCNAHDARDACRECDPDAWPRTAAPRPRTKFRASDLFSYAVGSGCIFVMVYVFLPENVRHAEPFVVATIGAQCGTAWYLWRWSILRQDDLPSQPAHAGVDEPTESTDDHYDPKSTSRYLRSSTSLIGFVDGAVGVGAFLLLMLLPAVWIAGALSPYLSMAVSLPVAYLAILLALFGGAYWRAKRNAHYTIRAADGGRPDFSPEEIGKLGIDPKRCTVIQPDELKDRSAG